MKKLVLLAALCAFVLGASVASAAELQVSGNFIVEGAWGANGWNFQKDNSATDSGFAQRINTTFAFVANENLKAVMQLRNTTTWGAGFGAIGAGDSVPAADNDHNALSIRQVYMDFMWPGTSQNVVAGYKNVTLPAEIGGSTILSEEVATAYVTGPITDNVSYLVGFARADDGSNSNTLALSGNDEGKESEFDVYYAAAPIAFDGFGFTPFFAYGQFGNNFRFNDGQTPATVTSGKIDDAWWLGTTFSMDILDPFTVKADLNYGKVSADNEVDEASGWLFALAGEYKGFDFMTPEAFFVYTSGDDKDSATDSSGRMPVIVEDWAVGSFFFGGDYGLNGSIGNNTLGFWTLGLSLKDIQSFTANLTHTVHVLYVQGTNENDATNRAGQTYSQYLTEDDSLFELDFNSYYKIYDELTLYAELGYINFDGSSDWNVNEESDAWKIATGLNYEF